MVRERVKEGAAWYVYSIQELIDELEPPPIAKREGLEVVGQATISNAFFGAGRQNSGRRVVMGTAPSLAAN